ncbi:MAG: hemolysin family protein [Gemmatimonadetes bacterium]|nr:hemolysin family protein [Gemmatimonadota bacterium]
MTAWIVGVGIVAAAFFGLAELTIVSVGRLRLRHWVRESLGEGDWIDPEAVERPYRLLAPILVGSAFAVTGTAIATAAALAGTGFSVGEGLRVTGWTLLVLVPPLYLVAEVLPRALARTRGHQLFGAVSVVLRGCGALFRPVIAAADAVVRLVVSTTDSPVQRRVVFSRRSLEVLLVESERVGIVEPAEREIIAGVFEFGRTPARAVMTPAERMATAPAGARAAEISGLTRETGYSRIPLYRDAPDRIVGFVHVFDLFKLDPDDVPRPRRIVKTTPATPCDDLLFEMKRRRCHLAVVVEDGRSIGMVTMEDLVEELVGEIRDEHDSRAEALAPLSGAFVVDGHTPIAEIGESRGMDLPFGRADPAGGAETVAGWVIARLGRIPTAGETFLYRGWTIDILDATPQRVRRVRFRPPPSGPS